MELADFVTIINQTELAKGRQKIKSLMLFDTKEELMFKRPFKFKMLNEQGHLHRKQVQELIERVEQAITNKYKEGKIIRHERILEVRRGTAVHQMKLWKNEKEKNLQEGRPKAIDGVQNHSGTGETRRTRHKSTLCQETE